MATETYTNSTQHVQYHVWSTGDTIRVDAGQTVTLTIGSSDGAGVVDGQQLFDGSHVLSLDAGSRTLNNGATPIINWTPTDGGATDMSFLSFDGVGSWFGRSGNVIYNAVLNTLFAARFEGLQLKSGADDLLAIDLENRRLYTNDGTSIAFDYGLSIRDVYFLSNLGAGTTPQISVDPFTTTSFIRVDQLQGTTATDNSGTPNIDLSNRKLYANDGITEMVNWSGLLDGLRFLDNNAAIRSISSVVGLDISAVRNWNGDGFANIDLENRKLYGENGTTAALAYSSSYVRFFPDNPVSIGQFYTSETDGVWLYVDRIGNNSTDGNPNIDLLNRKLYNPDGTTVAVDYGTNGQVSFGSLGNAFVFEGGAAGDDVYFTNRAGTIDINYSVDNPSANQFYINTTSGFPLRIGSDVIKLEALPTSDPHVANQLWKSGNDLKISTGL